MFLWHSSSRERGVAGVAFHSTLIVNQSSTYSTAVTSHHRGTQCVRQWEHHMDSLLAVDTPQHSRRSATFPYLIGTGEYSFLFWLLNVISMVEWILLLNSYWHWSVKCPTQEYTQEDTRTHVCVLYHRNDHVTRSWENMQNLREKLGGGGS